MANRKLRDKGNDKSKTPSRKPKGDKSKGKSPKGVNKVY